MKILISDKVREEGIQILEENGFKITKDYDLSDEQLKEVIGEYDAIIVRSGTQLTAEVLEKAKNLKAIGRAGVGLDNIDLKKAKELEIKVFNTPKAPSISVAELTVGLILCLVRNISHADRTMHCGEWCKSDYLGHTVHGQKLGLIGYGNIGQEVAKRCDCLGMKVGIYDKDPEVLEKAKELGFTIYRYVDDLIKDVNVISLHIPSTVETENTINDKRLDLMSKDTVIINTARGNLIDEEALVNALKNKKIGGAALDVYREEPLTNMDLCDCKDNLILTPHIGSQTIETQKNTAMMIAEKLVNYLKSVD